MITYQSVFFLTNFAKKSVKAFVSRDDTVVKSRKSVFSPFLSRNAAVWPPVVITGIFQWYAYRATGANTYWHTGPRNTSKNKEWEGRYKSKF